MGKVLHRGARIASGYLGFGFPGGGCGSLRAGLARLVATIAIAGLAGVTLSGCSKGPGYAPGCYMNGAVRKETRLRLEAASARFYGLLRSHLYDQAFDEASEQLRTHDSRDRMTGSWGELAETLTIPDHLTTEEVVVAVFPEGTRGPQRLACADPADPTGRSEMLTTDQPWQAYLIQTGEVAGQTYNFGSVWFFEPGRLPGQGRWCLSSVGVRPRLALGQDWRHWRDTARQQADRGNERNAALLLNLTMDLAVPAPWVRPAVLDSLVQEQRRIHTENLPFGRVLHWQHASGVEFTPYLASAEIGANGLILLLAYEVASPPDTALVAQQAPLLADFVRTTFPEYGEVFHELSLEATTHLEHQPVWHGTFPLKAER